MSSELKNKLDLQSLETWLWDSADILRGSVDSSDFKNYIFGLMFLKRVSDVFDEEIEKFIDEEAMVRKMPMMMCTSKCL